MPNWCNNVIELAHEDPAMIARADKALREGKFLQEFIPVPEDLQITAGFLGNGDEQKKLEEQEQRNLATHGYKNWYDWCVNEWGTKWDVGGDGIEPSIEGNTLTAPFDSAWAPPCMAYEKLLDLGFEVRAYYYEGGMNFAGIWDNGDDDFYDLPSSSAEVREQIPEVLDEMFGISESMEMWEEENNEEDAE
jgi:hypothetical protein